MPTRRTGVSWNGQTGPSGDHMTDAERLPVRRFGFSLALSSCVVDASPARDDPRGSPRCRDRVPERRLLLPRHGTQCPHLGKGHLRHSVRLRSLLPGADDHLRAGVPARDRLPVHPPGRQTGDGDYDIAAHKARWRGGALVQGSSSGLKIDGFIFFGDTDYSASSREGRLFRQADGKLVLTWSERKKGFIEGHADVGYRRERSVVVALDPMVGKCEVDTSAGPPRSWFEIGLDLRLPGCVTTLETQVAAILAEKGEAPQAASALAHKTVGSFSMPAEALRFQVRANANGQEDSHLFNFHVTEIDGACTLRLDSQGKRTREKSNVWASFCFPPPPGLRVP